MNLKRFIQCVETDNARQPGSHVTEKPATAASIAAWRKKHDRNLPRGLHDFYRWSNGLGLWCQRLAGEYISNGALYIYPLDGFDPADVAMYGEKDNRFPATWFAFGTEQDGQWFLVVDLEDERFLQVPPIVPDEAEQVASSFESCLDWIVESQKLVGGDLPDYMEMD